MDLDILARLTLQNRSARGSYSATSGNFQHTWQGRKEDVFALVGSLDYTELDPGGLFPLLTAEVNQIDGLIWGVTLRYQGDVSGVIGGGSGPRYHNLDCRPMSLPLETLSGYLLLWDHYLFGPENIEFIPPWWKESENPAKKYMDIPEDDRKIYRISKNIATLNALQPVDGVKWKVMAEPAKPGVKTRTVFVYEITESNVHRSESAASWAAVTAGEIVDKPPLGDFGINAKMKGNWRNWGGNVSQSGREFTGRVLYKHMPGNGWDPDLVEAVTNAQAN
ncbi:hypothetical protein [Victivallis lenta]|uniref:hypothetical protein n=1 Tax=Victivallis lenta TaxID=2606640 RepID=UPI0015B0BB52|nr:hypothetical protein [Victivallis lenta]